MNEQEIENELIEQLQELKYVYRPDIKDRDSLHENFRKKFEELNQVRMNDSEFDRLLEIIIKPDVFNSAKILREINHFSRDDGTPLDFTFVNTKDWCKNTYEVVNQLRLNTENSHHKYDVVLLINGIPVAQIELKTLNINPRRAMQQIIGYKNDPGNGYSRTLMCFLQLFIVSNRSETWYFANNDNRHFNFDADERFLPIYQDAKRSNQKITDLRDFAKSFLAKCTLGQMISRYMVLAASEQKLMIMRPYQIFAVKDIVNSIQKNGDNGYIWHTTGSGKTLTSFKASTLLKDNPDIEKCLFVVDRKDLDRQTREEFNRFQDGCVEENTNTETLVRRLLSDNYKDKVIVSTIQKLGIALDGKHKKNYKERLEPLRDKRIAIIFDECHRSQFGENHEAIKEFFPKAQLFGFTGTPISDENATYRKITGEEATLMTTVDVFEHELHAYTITNAIDDGNVLRFHIDYYEPKGKPKPKPGDPIAKRAIVYSILSKHDAATRERKFNAILATASINDAIEYVDLFKKVQLERANDDPDFVPLNITAVFSPPAKTIEDPDKRKDVNQLQDELTQEKADNEQDPERKKKALETIIGDYNLQFGTNHTIGEFDLYYQDVQKRIKDHQFPDGDYAHAKKVDITIVVDMLLTGFDSKYLNTLYVDKNLKHHGLIQAFSRTNRVLNDTKPYGNILDFRQQQDAVNEAIRLFSGKKDRDRAKEIWIVDPAPVVVQKYDDAVQQLASFLESQNLESKPADVHNLKGDIARAQFVNLFKDVQSQKNQLDQYTDLTDTQKETIENILPTDTLQAFKGAYLRTAERLREKRDKEGDKAVPEVQQLDFEFVLFASDVIDYDYIMKLIAAYSQGLLSKQKMTRSELIGLIASDSKFIGEREDIEAYINTLTEGEGLNEEQVREGYQAFKAEKQARELADIAETQGLKVDALQSFVDHILKRMVFDDDDLSTLLEPLGLGWKERTLKKVAVMDQLVPILNKRADGRDISGLEVYE